MDIASMVDLGPVAIEQTLEMMVEVIGRCCSGQLIRQGGELYVSYPVPDTETGHALINGAAILKLSEATDTQIIRFGRGVGKMLNRCGAMQIHNNGGRLSVMVACPDLAVGQALLAADLAFHRLARGYA